MAAGEPYSGRKAVSAQPLTPSSAPAPRPRLLFRGLRLRGAVDCCHVRGELQHATGRLGYRAGLGESTGRGGGSGSVAAGVLRLAAYASTGQVGREWLWSQGWWLTEWIVCSCPVEVLKQICHGVATCKAAVVLRALFRLLPAFAPYRCCARAARGGDTWRRLARPTRQPRTAAHTCLCVQRASERTR